MYKKRILLYKIQNGVCALCKRPIYYGKGTIDHIIPKSKGGTNDISNIQLVHYSCNQVKADNDKILEPIEYLKNQHKFLKTFQTVNHGDI